MWIANNDGHRLRVRRKIEFKFIEHQICSHHGEVGKCLKIAEPRKDRCAYHTREKIEAFNKECPVCLEEFFDPAEAEKTILLACGHEFHFECLSGVASLHCAVCNVEMYDLPETLVNKIIENKRALTAHNEGVNFHDLLGTFAPIMRNLMNGANNQNMPNSPFGDITNYIIPRVDPFDDNDIIAEDVDADIPQSQPIPGINRETTSPDLYRNSRREFPETTEGFNFPNVIQNATNIFNNPQFSTIAADVYNAARRGETIDFGNILSTFMNNTRR